MNGQHRQKFTKRYGEMAGSPTLSIQAEDNPNTNLKHATRTMATPRFNRMGLLSLLIPNIKKKHKGGQPIYLFYYDKVKQVIDVSPK